MKHLPKLLVICLSFSFLSCATHIGSNSLKEVNEENVGSRIVKNKTTKEQVLEQFGKPDVKASNASGEVIWGYQLLEFYGSQAKRLSITFGKNGRVTDYAFVTN
ncbi:MAG: hypothetical protein V4727_05710 [Verrucomicrobiota bacterium]